jgi:glycosyltransferase involved in cell wall biosynthesis
MRELPRLCIVTDYLPAPSETFIRAHIDHLPAKTTLIHGWRPAVDDSFVLSFAERAAHKALRLVSANGLERETTAAYVKAFRKYKPAAVLAEYGTTGVQAIKACEHLKIPLTVHFHGYDASQHDVLKENAETYPAMFGSAAAVIAVSRAMERKLISLGASPKKVHYNPYGVDCSKFGGASPAESPPVFIAVGRLVDKKAPQLTISAFAKVHREEPSCRLRLIGDGPLKTDCLNLVKQLGLDSAVTFLGVQPPPVVQSEMQKARCFVQHSVEAPNGDCEGTPVGIIEAGASGLPVVSTRHAGIPDVVVESQTGFLVNEGDVEAMADGMLRMIRSPVLAGDMGRQARQRIERHFSMGQSLGRLWSIIESTIQR